MRVGKFLGCRTIYVILGTAALFLYNNYYEDDADTGDSAIPRGQGPRMDALYQKLEEIHNKPYYHEKRQEEEQKQQEDQSEPPPTTQFTTVSTDPQTPTTPDAATPPQLVMKEKKVTFERELAIQLQKLRDLHKLSDKNPVKRKKILIISGWRQGSSFTQDIIASHPDVLKLYEPLILFKDIYLKKLRKWQQEPEALNYIKDLLNCNFNSPIMRKLRTNKFIYEFGPLMQNCHASKYGEDLCYDKRYLEAMCRMFPVMLMKFVRLPVSLLHDIMEDANLRQDMHVIFVPRDPRAILSSRWNMMKTKWCTQVECYSADITCKDLDEDLSATLKLMRVYPKQMHIIRYEDVALDPQAMAPKILAHLGLKYRKEVMKYVMEHTQTNNLGKKTYRQSETRVMAWAQEMSNIHLTKVQNSCYHTMMRFKYLPIHSTDNLTLSDVLGTLDYTLV